jgi:histidine ammonia-lyase
MSTVQRLIDLYNAGVTPEVFQQGSLGASGDLAPLAHMSLPLIGEGYAYLDGKRYSGKALLEKLEMKPIELKSKEGLALINGTQFMSAYGIFILLKAYHLSDWTDIIAAFSLEAYNARTEPFDELTHKIRPHIGQVVTAHHIRHLLKDGNLRLRKKDHVQDPYSFRCIPQVHGASKHFIDQAAGIFLVEINSVTDNPNLFPMDGKILSGGNFHGQILAIALDQLAIALAELGSISERRTYKLISGSRGLPTFLTKDPGLQSGLMISQYTAAGIVSQNKQYCTPASVDSITSSNGQEDHVSMGANAATKCAKVIDNLETIIGIELLNAMQALHFVDNLELSPKMQKVRDEYTPIIPFIETDKVLSEEIMKSVEFIKMHRYEIAPPMPRQNPKMN